MDGPPSGAPCEVGGAGGTDSSPPTRVEVVEAVVVEDLTSDFAPPQAGAANASALISRTVNLRRGPPMRPIVLSTGGKARR